MNALPTRRPLVLAARVLAMLGTLLTVSAAALAQGAAALVIDTQGTATLRSKAALQILAEVPPGTELTLAAGARAVLVHSGNGVEYTLSGPGEFRWGNDGAQALRGGQIATREPLGGTLREVRLRTARLVQASVAMRGEPRAEALQLASPASTWLLDPPALFRWAPVPGVQSYRFELTDDRGGVLFSAESVTATQIVLPAEVKLEAGRTYAWQVRTQRADGSRVEGWTEFGIAAPELAARARALQPAPEGRFADRLLYAALLEEWGLHEPADAVWASLRDERPEERNLAARASRR